MSKFKLLLDRVVETAIAKERLEKDYYELLNENKTLKYENQELRNEAVVMMTYDSKTKCSR
jgi:regulator of replication initiation timing